VGANLVVSAKTPEKAANAVKLLTDGNSDGAPRKGLRFGDQSCHGIGLDLSSLRALEFDVGRFLGMDLVSRLDGLVFCADHVGFPGYTVNPDGIEAMWAYNYLAYFYLTKLLMPKLKRSTPSRVVLLSSSALVQAPNPFHVQHLPPDKTSYNLNANYGLSKLCAALFAVEMNRRYNHLGITAYSYHPGTIKRASSHPVTANELCCIRCCSGDGCFASLLRCLCCLSCLWLPEVKSEARAAATPCFLATTDASLLLGGLFYRDCVPEDRRDGIPLGVRNDARNAEKATSLWEVTERLLAEKLGAYARQASLEVLQGLEDEEDFSDDEDGGKKAPFRLGDLSPSVSRAQSARQTPRGGSPLGTPSPRGHGFGADAPQRADAVGIARAIEFELGRIAKGVDSPVAKAPALTPGGHRRNESSFASHWV